MPLTSPSRITSPLRRTDLRRTDLVHAETALTARVEEFIFRDRLPLTAVEAHSECFILRPTLSPRTRQWLIEQPLSHHLWLDVGPLDPYGTHLAVSREPFGACAALCHWQDLPPAASHLRTQGVGPLLWQEHKQELLQRVVDELAHQFGIEKRPLNSKELPSLARTKWGFLIQLHPEQQDALIDYLLLPVGEDKSLPILEKIGGNISVVLGLGTDLTRLALTFNGMEELPLSEAQKWIPHLPQDPSR